MALKHMSHADLSWDELYNNNLDELDARTTANGGVLHPPLLVMA